MQDIGLHWNQKKCSVVHVKRGVQVLDKSGMRMDETTTITALGEGKHYKFLGVLENVRQDERMALACAAKIIYAGYLLYGPAPCLIVTVYRQLISMHSRSCGTKCGHGWTLSELRDVDRAARKIIVENRGKHPASLTSLLYLPREKGGSGLRSVDRPM